MRRRSIGKASAWTAVLLTLMIARQPSARADVEFRPTKLMPARPPLTELKIASTATGDLLLKPDELVVGISIEDESRAYPLNMIKGPAREILNDSLGGEEILVTWCSLCFSSFVFDRQVAGDTLNFGMAGMLWKNNMVFYDIETRSLWSQLLRRAMHGSLKGTRLKVVPSTITSWGEWRKRFPDSTVAVFERTTDANTVANFSDSQSLLIGIPEDGGKTWQLAKLKETKLINDVWKGQGVLAAYAPSSGTAQLFSRDFGELRFEFQWSEGKLQDRQTGSTWDIVTGEAIDGPLRGARLPRVTYVLSFEKTWRLFFQESNGGEAQR